jgi:serine/threonine protein kinase
LGEGAYGKVFKVRRKSDNKTAALKTIHQRGEISHEEITNEIGLMKMCIHDSGILDIYETY